MAKLIFQTDSDFYPIQIWQTRNKRWLRFGNENNQTAIDLQQPAKLLLDYLYPMVGALHFVERPSNCLILGLGGGALVRYLREYDAKLEIDAVEINPILIPIVKKYFLLPDEDNYFHIIIDDAVHYMESCRKHYDVIFVDLYTANALPSGLLQPAFYRHLANALSKRGVVALNIFCPARQGLLPIVNLIRHSFEQRSLCLPVKGHSNTVIMTFADRGYLKKIEQLTQEKKLTRPQLDSLFGLIASNF